MAEAIAKAFVELQVDKKKLDSDLRRKLPDSVKKASQSAKLSPDVDMAGMSKQIQTGLPALDRALILAGSQGGTSFMKAFHQRLLVASLERGQGSIFGSISKTGMNLKTVFGGIGSIFSAVGAAAGPLIAALGPAGLAGIIALVTIGLMKMGAALEMANSKLQAMVKTTSSIAGQNLVGLDKMAKKLQNISGESEEVIKNAQAVMLSFTNVRGEIFERAMKSAQDLSVLMGQDIISATKQLGKALSDPATQLGTLAESGVTFTAEQKKQIKQAAELGNIYRAQQLMLAAIESQSEGVAKATGETLSGSWSLLVNNFKEMLGSAGQLLATFWRIPQALRAIGQLFGFIQSAIEGVTREVKAIMDLTNIVEGISKLWAMLFKGDEKRLETEKSVTDEVAKQMKLIEGGGFESISKLAQRFALDQSMKKTEPIFAPTSATGGPTTMTERVVTAVKEVVQAITFQTNVMEGASVYTY